MSKLKAIIIGVVVLAGVAGLGAHVYTRIKNSAPLPKFSFDAAKAPGWSGSKNVNVQAVARTSNYTGEEPIEKLPVADLTVRHDISGSDIPTDNCFVLYSYYNRALGDIAAAHKDYVGRKDKLGGKVEKFEPLKQVLATFEGEKSYDLQQYRYVIEGKDTLQGYQIGFVPLESGYIRVEGVCKTYEDLALIAPTMQSVKLLDR